MFLAVCRTSHKVGNDFLLSPLTNTLHLVVVQIEPAVELASLQSFNQNVVE